MQTQYSTYRTLLAPVSGHGLSEAEAQDILRQILPHLVELHDRQQAHGSISLDTVAYDYDRMQIILLESSGTNLQIYLAPEVLTTQQATPTADIYAIGVVIIVLLTGFPPEALRTPNNTWNWQELCTVSDQFMQILNTALSSEPAFRYSNAGQMLQSLQPVINPSESTITSLAAPLLLPSPLLTNSSSKSSSPQTPLTTELNSLGSLNSGINNSHRNKKLKVNFSNSQIYRKAKAAKNQSKSNVKDLTRALLTMLLGGGVTVSGAVGAYFYMQSQSASSNGSRNGEFANSINQSTAQSIAPIDEAQKSDTEKWQVVVNTIKEISQTPYWQSRGKEIIKEAKQKLTIPVVPASQSVTVPASNVDPPRNLPSETSNNPPIEIYTPRTEAYNLPSDTYTPPTETYNRPTERSTSPLPPAPRVAR